MKKIAIIAIILYLAFYFIKDNSNTVNTLTIHEYENLISANSDKIIIANVFASWCPPCVTETPDFVSFYNSMDKKDVYLIGLSVDTSHKDIDKFIKKYNIPYPIFKIDINLQQKLMANTIPMTAIYKKDNIYFTSVRGIMTVENLKDTVRSLSK